MASSAGRLVAGATPRPGSLPAVIHVRAGPRPTSAGRTMAARGNYGTAQRLTREGSRIALEHSEARPQRPRSKDGRGGEDHLHGRSLDPHHTRVRRAAPGSWRRAGGGRPHHAQVASQPAVQPRCAFALAPRREDRLPAPEGPGRATSRAARLHQPRLAERLVPRLRGLHAERGLRERPRAPRAARGPVPDGDHVRRGGAMAVPPVTDRRRSHSGPMASAPYPEPPDRPSPQAHALPYGALWQAPLRSTEEAFITVAYRKHASDSHRLGFARRLHVTRAR